MNTASFHVYTVVILLVWGTPCTPVLGTKLVVPTDNGFQVFADNLNVISHESGKKHAIQLAKYNVTFKERLGSFTVNETAVIEKTGPETFTIERNDENLTSILFVFGSNPDTPQSTVRLELWDGEVEGSGKQSLSFALKFESNVAGYNRIYLRLESEQMEKIYGLGEQYSYLNLKGRSYTIWTREQGVGRNLSDPFTDLVNLVSPGSGGDYDHTYWPQPSYVSSSRYFFMLQTHAYANFNFEAENETIIYAQTESSLSGYFFVSNSSLLHVVQTVSELIGRQPALPDWAISGAILGVQGGTEKVLEYVRQAEESGVQLSGIWIQDWSGKIQTTFGTRVFWNWRWNETWYPRLDQEIVNLREKGIRLLAYINPYLNVDGDVYAGARDRGNFLVTANGTEYMQDFGEFNCVTLDFWSEDAVTYYKDLIKRNLLDFGFSGWMADFGEYTPLDTETNGGGATLTAMERHNMVPLLWAKLNREAVEEAGLLNDTMFWTRSGAAGASKYTTMLWAGDQNVDWRLSDGLPSTITAALSAAMSGVGLSHFDIGGYTTISQILLIRSQELLLRSAEYAVFTPVMRTHEGNQPAANHQVYSSNATWRSFGRLTRMHHALAEYTREAISQYVGDGVPVMSPLFLHYESDPESFQTVYQYLYGRDLLVAPILESNKNPEIAQKKVVYLPPDDWVHLWDENGTIVTGPVNITVDSPLGFPPVFYRAKSSWADLFRNISSTFGSI